MNIATGVAVRLHGTVSFFLATACVLAVFVFGALLCAQCSSAVAAEKRSTQKMVFSIVRASNPICEPLCPEWIAADGEIAGDTAKAFKAILKKVGKRNLPLLINSSGGNVDQAMEMGRIIRKRQMTVEVARTDYLHCGPRDKKCRPELGNGIHYGYANTIGAYCFSACPLVLAGGVRRIAGPVSAVGVHQITTSTDKYRNKYKIWSERQKNGKIVEKRKLISRKKVGTVTTTELSKKYRRKLEKYLVGMGVQSVFIELMISTNPEDILLLNVDELRAFGVATEIRYREYLVGYRDCEGAEPPDHCVERKQAP